MATFAPGDEVNDDRKTFSCYDTVTNALIIYDFNAAGYAANALLNILAQGEVKLYGSTDPNFGSFITVNIVAVPTVANGIVMKRDAATNTGAYLTYNLPLTPNTIFYFKAVLRKTNEANRVTIYWQHNTTS
jgi:hypothetical protein